MKIGIQTWGSQGDVRPFVALAGRIERPPDTRVTLAATTDKSLLRFFSKAKF